MSTQQLEAMYDQAHRLAESGQHQEALNILNDYLFHRPQDGRAVNDAATILFCMGRSRDAIALYEKASQLCTGDQLAQVLWNLCEAYLQEGMAGPAIALFDRMEAMELLNVDMLHRAADVLLEKRFLGPAVELLMRSLRMNADQDILKAMIEVIRGHRARTEIVICNKHTLAASLAEGLQPRLPLEVFEQGASASPSSQQEADITIVFGCGPSLIEASSRLSQKPIITVLDEQDLCDARIQAVHWHNVQTVILCGGAALVEFFAERVGALPKELTVLSAEPIANPERAVFRARRRGKRIAAVGPWDAQRNPMFALMCFQKLHYLDSDTRLHLGGEFVDLPTRRYVEHLIETLELDNVVFLDGPIQDMNKWLRDKHYLLSTAIDGAGFETIWQAMACGLRPVVHTFAGLDERLDQAYTFTLAEDFCDHILSRPYEPATYHDYVQQAYAEKGLEPLILDQIFRFEQELSINLCDAAVLPSVEGGSRRCVTDCGTGHAVHQPLEQMASHTLTALQDFSNDTQRPPAPCEAAPLSDTVSEFNDDGGLSVEQMTQFRRDNTQRRRRTPANVS